MSTKKLLFVLFYFQNIFCFGFQNEKLYRNDAWINDYICKDDVFRHQSASVMQCAAMCKRNASCFSFFYNVFNGECTACKAVYTQDNTNPLRRQTKTIYYHEILPNQQSSVHAKTSSSSIDTTPLHIETLWDPNNIPNYIVNTMELPYRDAMNVCERSKGARLSLVDTPDENAHLKKMLNDKGVKIAYIGVVVRHGKLMDGFDSAIESPYTNNIDVDQPPDGSCITLKGTTGEWNLVECQFPFPSICESTN